MRSRRLLVVLSAVPLIGGCQPKPAAFTPQDEAAILALNDSAAAYIRRADWTSWANLSADDAVFQRPNGKALSGRTAIEAWARSLPPVEEIRSFDVRVSGSGDLAYLTSGFAMKMKNVPADTAKQLVVLRRANGGWKAIALSFNSDLPVPTPPATKTATKTATKR